MAIPGSQLGDLATYTTTVSGSYEPPSTVSPSTIFGTTEYGSFTVSNATVVPGYTVPGTSVGPTTYTITTTRANITPPITVAGGETPSAPAVPGAFAIVFGLVGGACLFC